MNAIVSLDFCSASFYFARRLIATNYHCVERDFIQPNSSLENDLFEKGFLASSKQRSFQFCFQNLNFMESKDITNEILQGTSDETESLEDLK